MSVNTTRYIRKALYVDAVRVTKDNFDALAKWCDGTVGTDSDNGDKSYIHVRVVNPKNVRQTRAFVGDWILYTERGYKVYTNKAFIGSFDEVIDEPISKPVEANFETHGNGTSLKLGDDLTPGITVGEAFEAIQRGITLEQLRGENNVHPDQGELEEEPGIVITGVTVTEDAEEKTE